MNIFVLIWNNFSLVEKKIFYFLITLILILIIIYAALFIKLNSVYVSIPGGVYKEGILGQPININPIFSSNPVDQKISYFIYYPLYHFLKNIDISPDGKTYTLQLKDNVKWSDGKNISSDDIVFTIKAIQNYRYNSPLFYLWQGVKAQKISSIQVKINIPSENFLFEKNIKNLQIIPSHIFEAIPPENIYLSDYKLEPITNGPYKFEKMIKRKDGFITNYKLSINPLFEGEKYFIQKVEFVFFQNDEELNNAFLTKKINAFGYYPTQNININSENLKSFNQEKIKTSSYYASFFNQTNNASLKDISVRKALVLSIDKKNILEEIGPSFWEPISNIYPENEDSSSYDPETAQNLISKFKSKNKNAKIVLNLVIPENQIMNKIAEKIKSSWISAGVDEVNIEAENMEGDSSPLKTRAYDILLLGASFQNTEDVFSYWHSSQINYPGINFASYQNSKADTLIEKIRETKDETERKKYFKQLSDIIKDDYPAAFLFSPFYIFIYSKDTNIEMPQKISSPKDLYLYFDKWFINKVRIIKKQ